jgi:hypothetical protein
MGEDLEIDDYTCVDGRGEPYPEHDYEVFDESEEHRTLVCRRCGAESYEDLNEEA